jgi:pimeloyl-ACP methyl ester carboxylesterase
VLLLHGHPQTHAMWHAVAESLAKDFTIVATDLPGYGRSAPTATGSKRENLPEVEGSETSSRAARSPEPRRWYAIARYLLA